MECKICNCQVELDRHEYTPPFSDESEYYYGYLCGACDHEEVLEDDGGDDFGYDQIAQEA